MPEACRPRAVVFDLDGLMFNTEELYDEVGEALLVRRGHRFSAELKQQMMGRPARVALQLMIDRHGLADAVAALAEESDAIFAGILPHRLAMMPGLPELLDALERAGLPKAIATSSGRRFVETVLGRFDLAPRFQFALTAEDVVEGKPHPEIYLKAATRLGLAPRDVLVLEDSPHGCRAAVEAGTYAVAVPGWHTRQCDFSAARLVAESLADRRLYAALGLAGE
jgi:HAD superfamily hydrolase (TIGR01509 family)